MQELRSAAFTANLRRAFGTPAEGDVPSRFAVLLDRLSEVQPPPAPISRRDPYRLGT